MRSNLRLAPRARAAALVLMILTLGFRPTAAPAVCTLFGAATNYTAGTSPAAVALGDFNSDGIMDAAVPTVTPSAVRIFLGQGAGGVGNGIFGANTAFSLTSLPRGVCVGDFNADGILDLAVLISSNVSILFGQGSGGVGNGTFGAPTNYVIGTNPQQVITTDLNEDGILDLVATNAGSSSISVLLGLGSGGNGNGTFAAAVNYAVGTSPVGLCAGDFNFDGIVDIAVANNSSASNSVSILLGQGAGGLGNGLLGAATNFPCGNNPVSVAVGDFNENGILDLALATGSGVSILLGNGSAGVGTGTFAAAVNYAAGTAPRGLVVADFNEDDIADVAVTNSIAAGTITVLAGNGTGGIGDGTFAAGLAFSAGTNPQALAVGELSEDGHADLFVANNGSGNASVLLGTCAGGLANGINLFSPNGGEIATPGQPLNLSWVRGAGVLSARVEVSRDNGVTWRPLADHVFKKGFTWNVTGPLSNQALIRVSDDAVPGRTDRSAAVFSICNPFAATNVHTGPGPVLGVATADFDRDGLLDLFVVSDSLMIRPGHGSGGANDGTFGVRPSTAETGLVLCRPAVADFNHDGILDLAFGRTTGVGVRLGNGQNGTWNGTFGSVSSLGTGVVKDLVLGDFDEDGVPDAAYIDASTDRVLVTRFASTSGVPFGATSTTQVQAAGGGAERLATADFNEDGILDLVVTNGATNTLKVYRGSGTGGQGTGSFTLLATAATAAFPRGIATGDFNGDGILDLAITCPDGGVVSTFLGPGSGGVGSGLFSTRTDTAVPFLAGPIAATDYNRDGAVDLVVVRFDGSLLQFLQGSGTGLFSPTLTFGNPDSGESLLVSGFNADGGADYLVGNQALRTLTLVTTVCPPAAPALVAVNSPVAGDSWNPHEERTISWSRSGPLTAVDVELSRNGGLTWETLATNVIEDQFVYTVTAPGARQAQVRVTESITRRRQSVSAPFASICDLVEVPRVGAAPGAGAAMLLRDFDGDGLLDLASVTGSAGPTGQVLIQRGQGAAGVMDGTFAPAVGVTVPGGATGLTAGDFNADGIMDLVAATTAGLYRLAGNGGGGTGNGTFAAPVALSSASAWAVRTGDFNEDGILDLVSTDSLGTGITVRLGLGANGQGNGAFAAATTFPATARAGWLALGDFNEDGVTDVAATSPFAGTPAAVYVFPGLGAGGKGNGGFGPVATYAATGNTHEIVTGDFNDDGIIDLALAQGSGNPLLVLRGNGTLGVGDGTFSPGFSVPQSAGATHLTVGDLNGDGIADLVSNGATPGLGIARGRGLAGLGDGTFSGAREFVTPAGAPGNLLVADLVEDGTPDVFGLSPDFVMAGTCPAELSSGVSALAPHAGDDWEIGSEQTITFTRGSGSLAVDVELSRDGGTHWTRLAENVTDKFLKWTVTPPISSQARVRVTDSQVRGRNALGPLFHITMNPSAVPLPGGVPAVATLSAASPNPTSGPTQFTLAAPTRVEARVEVFDLAGRRVRTLQAGSLEAGEHALVWDGDTDEGRPAAQGLYFVRASWPGFEAVRKVARVR